MKNSKLFLHEEIFLLALKDQAGTIACGTWYTHAVGGALLAELLLSGRIKIEEVGKKQFAKLVNRKPFGDEILDECIEKLSASKRRAVLSTWVGRFANLRKLRDRVAIELCKKKILKADEKTVLWIFTRKIYPELNPKPEKEIIERARKAIFTNARDVDPRTTVLVTLAHATQILPVVFDKKTLKTRKDRLHAIVNGELIGKATKTAVEAVQAALMVTTIMPAVMVATMNH